MIQRIALLWCCAYPLFGPGVAAGQSSALWGSLERGPHAVGYRVLYRVDRSRAWVTSVAIDHGEAPARPVRMSVWYPAVAGTGSLMRYQDYVHHGPPSRQFARLDSALAARDLASLQNLFANAKSSYQQLMSLPVAARRSAASAPGRHPVVMYSQGWNSSSQNDNTVLAEYLASNGYVVVGLPQVGDSASDLTLRISARDLEIQMRDIEFAMGESQTLSMVDPSRLALAGWSMGGVVSLLIAGRNWNVDAVVGLDASFRARDLVDLVLQSSYFELRRLRAPLLALQSGNPKYTDGQSDRVVDSLHFADRYLGRVADITHGDFSDFAMIARLYPVSIIDRTAAQASRGHEAIVRAVLWFLNGHLKKDEEALAWLRDSAAVARGSGQAISLGFRRAAAVPSETEFVAMIGTEGIDRSVARLRALEREYPHLTIVRYSLIVRSGYRLLDAKAIDSAIAVFRFATEAFPASADAYDSLADGYLAKGDSARAAAAYQRVLELLPGDPTLSATTKEELRARASSFLGRKVPADLPGPAQATPPVRILFIGNSYTYVNNLPEIVSALGAGMASPIRIETQQVTVGGATLRQLWNAGPALAAIRGSRWDYVVLQEQSTLGATFVDGKPVINDPNRLFWPAVRLFDEAIRKSGARTVLLETWGGRGAGTNFDALAHAYFTIGKELGAIVIPAGLAWQRALAERPDLPLYLPDGSHPAAAGSYLAGIVAISTLFDVAPNGVPLTIAGHPTGLDGKPADTLGTLAAIESTTFEVFRRVLTVTRDEMKRAHGYPARGRPETPAVAPLPAGRPIPPGGLTGVWQGSLLLLAADGALPLRLDLRANPDGSYTGSATIELQPPLREDPLAIKAGARDFEFSMTAPVDRAVRIQFRGVLKSEDELVGTATMISAERAWNFTGSWTARRRPKHPS